MPPATSGAVRASVSVEDISRQYYESAGYSMWITQMHVDPLELIVADDASGKLYRVPVEMGRSGTFAFGDAQEVAIEYKDVKTPAGTKAAASMPYRWPTREVALAAAGVQPPAVEVTTTPPAADPEPPVAPDVSPAGAAIRKMAATATHTPVDAAPADGQTDTKEAASMDVAKLKEAFGLPADASDDDVKAAALAVFGEGGGKADASAKTGDAPDPAALLAALPDKAGVVVLDKENYKTLLDRADQGVQALAMARAGERDKILEQSMREGRFPVAKLSEYKRMWDKNPDATRDFITMLPKNSVPTLAAAGLLGQEFDKSEADLAYDAYMGGN